MKSNKFKSRKLNPINLNLGNEIQPPGEKLKPGHVRDSNKTTLTCLLRDQV